MTEVAMWIDHRHDGARGGETMPVENPATEETIALVPRAQAADVAVAVERARSAQRLEHYSLFREVTNWL